MPTLEDVARRAGVSTATVSKVLSNTPYFTAATREKVLRAVEELGYVPNLAARALSSGKTHIIGVVFPYLYDTIFTDPNIMTLLQGIEAECNAQGYNLLLSTPRVSASGLPVNFVQLLHSGYLDGMIVLGHPVATVLDAAQARGVPAVGVGYCEGLFVRVDDRMGARLLMEHILGLGHRAVGLITVPEGKHAAAVHRLAGLRDAACAAGLDPDALPTAAGDWSQASGSASALRLLTAHPDLTALICFNDRMAMGAIQQARTLGRQVPGDLSIVGYDDIPAASIFYPALTTVSQRAIEVGQLAARMLFEVLDGGTPEPLELPARLVVRASAGPVHGAQDRVTVA